MPPLSEPRPVLSKFLLNRQKITDPARVLPALREAFPDGTAGSGPLLFHAEWGRIGVSIPLHVQSLVHPKVVPIEGLHLYESQVDAPGEVTDREVPFQLCAHPASATEEEIPEDEEQLLEWLKRRFSGAATLINADIGPRNTLYYEAPAGDATAQQAPGRPRRRAETVVFRGRAQVIDPQKWHKLRLAGVGPLPHLGCGLILLDHT